MKTTVLDSSALLALLIANDPDHTKAVAVSKTIEKTETIILLPVEVLSETLNLLGKMREHFTDSTVRRNFAANAGKQILSDPGIQTLAVSSERMQQALEKWQDQPSDVSYTDCLVMAAADEAGTKSVYGFDAAFAKNGYQLPEAA